MVREFPTAPKDSFFIANASYVARATGSPAYQDLLVRTNGSPPAVAREVRRVLGPASGAVVQDINTQLRVTLSGLTALDLSGLTRLELAFAFILAAAASGLVLALGLVERRRTFAIAAALGARSRQLASFVWSEAIFVTIGGALLGVLSGWALSFIITKILTGVFDPPPPHLFVPVGLPGRSGRRDLRGRRGYRDQRHPCHTPARRRHHAGPLITHVRAASPGSQPAPRGNPVAVR